MANDKERSLLETTMGRSVTGSVCGAAVVVLAILGLVHVFPEVLVTIATIVFGVALLIKGGVISAEYSKLLSHLSGEGHHKMELAGGMSVEVMTGIAGIVLGILALMNIASETLVAIAVITFGLGAAMGSSVLSRLNALKLEALGSEGTHHKVAHDMLSAAVGTQLLSGVAAIVLGILVLTGTAPMVLSLVALLILGADSLLSGGALTGKLFGDFAGR